MTPTFAKIKIPNTSPASKFMQLKATKIDRRNEISEH